MNIRDHVSQVVVTLRAWAVRPFTVIDLHDAFTFGGLALTAYGVGQIYPPLGWIVPGVTFMWLGIQGAK
ncbi:MAG: hypothetical protein ACOY9J_03405 [Pseudomonadota bacterium]